MERIRVNVLKNKEMVEEMKRLKQLELEEKRMKINEIKNRVEGTLSTWRDNLQ